MAASGDDGAKATWASASTRRSPRRSSRRSRNPTSTALFGKAKYALADDRAEPRTGVIEAIRVGHEIFPWLMVLILILVTAENSWPTGSTARRPGRSRGRLAGCMRRHGPTAEEPGDRQLHRMSR